MNFTRKSLLGAFAVVASLSAPLAFAQQSDPAGASAQATTSTDASAQATAAAQPTTSNDAAAATPASVAKKSWADVDLDKDGNLSKAEAAAVPSLGQVFDKADSNADGSLTAIEYKAYVKTQGGKK
ncbi:EF-hand domain-containing protein [Lysobacter tyrosinilyticus]